MLKETHLGRKRNPMPRIRSAMTVETAAERLTSVSGQRPLTPSDGAAYGALLYLAYHGSVDDDGETLEDGLKVGPGMLAADRENLVRECSAGIWRQDELVASVVIITLLGDHWIDPVITHPDYRRQGLAQHLIRWASGELNGLGIRKLRLAVTDSNKPAVSLYQKLGFVRDGPWASYS